MNILPTDVLEQNKNHTLGENQSTDYYLFPILIITVISKL